MAYTTKYHFQITDNKGVITLVRLKLRDYTGADNSLTHGGITFEFGKNRTASVVRGSSARVGLWSLTQGQYAEFRDITDRKWMVEVLKGGQPYWYGWLTPEIFSEPFKHSLPYRIELTAVDGLGDLQNIDYKDADGDKYTGRDSFKTIINRCLNSTAFALPVCFSSSIWPTGTYGYMFEECYYANSSFIDKDGKVLKCSEVLEQFSLFGITVKQWRGNWYVLRTEDLSDNTLVYEYDSAGNYVDDYYLDLNSTIDDTATPGAENLPIGQSGLMSQEAAYKEASVKIVFGKKPSFLNNYNFSLPGDSWTGTLDYKEGKNETYGRLYNQDASGATTGIHQSVDVVATDEDFVFSIKVAPFGWSTAGAATMHPIPISIRLQVKLTGSSTYYLNKVTGWTTTPCYIDIADLESSMSGSDINWHDIKIFTNALPISGVLDVFLCKLPYIGSPSTDLHWVGVGYTQVYAYNDGESYLSSKEIKGVNNPDYNFIPATAELKINDCPNVANGRLLYSNYISDASGVPTTTWSLDGVAGSMTIAEMFLRHTIALHRRPVKVVAMTMRGSVEWPGTMSDRDGNRYEVVSATLMDRNCEWQLELREILTFEDSSPVITEGARIYDNKSDSVRTVNDKNDYRTYLAGIGSPKRINDLTRATTLDDSLRMEVDKPGITESQYVEYSQFADYIKSKLGAPTWSEVTSKPTWTEKFGWDGTKVTVSTSMHITGNLSASEEVTAWIAGAVTSDVLANLTATAPLRKSSASNIVFDYNTSHFEIISGAIQIKSGVLAPAAHTHIIGDTTGLQAALDGKQATGSYLTAITKSQVEAVLTGAITTHTHDYLATSLKGSNNGLAELDASGFVKNTQLPSYVDDVLEYSSFSTLPATGESGKIYITIDDNKTYRWSGSVYAIISDTLALGETSATAYRGDRGKTAYDHSQSTHYLGADISAWAKAASKPTYNTSEVSESGNLYYTEVRVAANSAVTANTAKVTFPGFGTTAGTAAVGNDSRINNGQTAYGWTDHAGKYRLIGYIPAWSEVTSKPTWTEKFGWDGTKVTVSTPMHITGTLTATEDIVSWWATAVSGDVMASLTATAPLRKSSATNMVLDINTSQFEVSGGLLQIKSGILAPAAHNHIISDITGLQTTLDGKLATGDVYSWAKATTKPSYTYSEVGALAVGGVAFDSDKLDGQHGSYYEPAFSKNTGFNKAFGSTSGTVLEGRTFGTAANSATGDFAPSSTVTMTYPASDGIALKSGAGWGTSITNNSSNWNTAFGWGNHAGLYQPLENQRLSTTNSPTFAGATLTGAFALPNSVYHTMGGAKFMTGGAGTNYLFTGSTNMIWRNQADNADVMALTNSGVLSVLSSIATPTGKFGGFTSYGGSDAVQSSSIYTPIIYFGTNTYQTGHITENGISQLKIAASASSSPSSNISFWTNLAYVPQESMNLSAAGNLAVVGTITANTSFIIKNSSGVTKWTITLGGSDILEFKNASGVVEAVLTQAGNLSAKGEVAAYATM